MKPVAATILAMLLAAVLLVTIVLPAELGLDPLGTGKRLGLLGLSGELNPSLRPSERTLVTDQRTFELAPFESVEVKYVLSEYSGLVYGWDATGEVVSDLHAEPDGAEEGYAESILIHRGKRQAGTYVAPFAGRHGWFFENRGTEIITVTLAVAGFAEATVVYRDGYPDSVPFQPQHRR